MIKRSWRGSGLIFGMTLDPNYHECEKSVVLTLLLSDLEKRKTEPVRFSLQC